MYIKLSYIIKFELCYKNTCMQNIIVWNENIDYVNMNNLKTIDETNNNHAFEFISLINF